MFLQENPVRNFREKHNEGLPKWYRWQAHIFFNFLLLLLAFFFVGKQMVWTFMVVLPVVAFVFIWGVIEYFLHRFLLHGQRNSNLRIRQEHSVQHHGYFTHLTMTAQTGLDTNRILLFPVDLAALVGVNLGLSYVLSFITTTEVGIIFCFSGLLYILIYESLHAICHLSMFHKQSLFHYWTRHHAIHHDQNKMGRNFSVVFPFLDRLLGTQHNFKVKK